MASPEYDHISEAYREAKRLPFYEVVEYSLLDWLGDIRGKTVLDLACGEGFNTRRLKERGTARTVGVDISTEMIRLAQEQNDRDSLGIEYLVGRAQDVSVIGQFDIVTSVFLLNFAESADQLTAMCAAAYRNLRSGQRFVSINDNCGRAAMAGDVVRQYGFGFIGEPPVDDGDVMRLELAVPDGSTIGFDIRYFHRETYEKAFHTAGFREVHWHDLVIPDELLDEYGADYWATFVTTRPLALIACVK